MTREAPAAEVDLDAREDRPAGARHPFAAVLAVAAVVGLVLGTSARSALREAPPAEPAPTLTATSSLRAVLLTPEPTAVLDVNVSNRGEDSMVVETLTTEWSGTRQEGGVVERVLQPRRVAVLTVRLPVACAGGGDGAQPPLVRVTTRPFAARTGVAGPPQEAGGTQGAPASSAVVEAVPVGELARLGGVCSAADDTLPRGWRSPVPGSIVRADDAGLRLRVSGLPRAGFVFVNPDPDAGFATIAKAAPVRAGSATLDVERPGISCDRPPLRGLPTALPLYFSGQDGPPRPYLAQVGTGLSRWLLRQWDLACPDGPTEPEPPS